MYDKGLINVVLIKCVDISVGRITFTVSVFHIALMKSYITIKPLVSIRINQFIDKHICKHELLNYYNKYYIIFKFFINKKKKKIEK